MNINTIISILATLVTVVCAILAKLLMIIAGYLTYHNHKRHKQIKEMHVDIKKKHHLAQTIDLLTNHKKKVDKPKEAVDKDLQELKKRCENLKKMESFQSDNTWQATVISGEQLIKSYTNYVQEVNESESENSSVTSNETSDIPLLNLKDSAGKVVARISPDEVTLESKSSMYQSLEPVIIQGVTIREQLKSGIEQIKRELTLEKANPSINFFSRRLVFSAQYGAYLSSLKDMMPSDNATLLQRREWQEINDLFRTYQVHYDELVKLKQVDMTSGEPRPVLEKPPSVDELDLSDNGVKLQKK